MQLGLFNLMTQRDASSTPSEIVADTLSMVKLADELGFDTAWFAEHHFSNYSICCSPLMMAAFCAGQTRRIRLGPAVLVLPLYDPVRVIQELGLLDVQSGGRMVIGIGYGYQQYEFDRFRQKLAEKGEVSMEIWDMIERAMREGRIGHAGKHFKVPDSPMAVRPLQAEPEMFVTGLEPAVLQRTARAGHWSFITAGWRGIALAREQVAHIHRQYEAAGVPLSALKLAVQQYVFVTDDKAEALELGERARSVARIVTEMRATPDPRMDGPFIQPPPLPDEPPLETFRDNLVFGDPHLVAEKLVGEIRELGTAHLSCFMQIGSIEGRRARRSLERFVKEVVPLMEKAFGMPLAEVNVPRPAAAGKGKAAAG